MMKRKIFTTVIICSLVMLAIQLNSCKVSEGVQAKTGAQLWSENCSRCHNIPSPTDFSDGEWTVIGTHMRVRANLTADESAKILEFLKMAN